MKRRPLVIPHVMILQIKCPYCGRKTQREVKAADIAKRSLHVVCGTCHLTLSVNHHQVKEPEEDTCQTKTSNPKSHQ